MNITIAENLKSFRKEHGNTQEELANHLGISVQAVSKWERNEGYPDITLLPSIASYYGKTVDELLGCAAIEQEKRIAEIMQQYAANGNAGKIEDNITLMRSALKEFPNHLSLMAELAHSLFFTNKTDYLDECQELCEKILRKSTDDSQRYSVLQHLVYACSRKGEINKAKEYAEKLPNLYCTRNSVLESVLEGEDRRKLAQGNILLFIRQIDMSVSWMLSSKDYTPEEKIFAYETIDKLYKLFYYDGNYGFYHCSLQTLWAKIAGEYAHCKNAEKALHALKTAAFHAYEMDHLKTENYTSLFADTASYSKESYVRNFEKSYTELIKETMENPLFDFIRETETFQKILPVNV